MRVFHAVVDPVGVLEIVKYFLQPVNKFKYRNLEATHEAHIPSFYILYSIQVCPIEPTRLLVKELREGGKTNIDMVEWEQVCSQVLLNIFLYATLMYL